MTEKRFWQIIEQSRQIDDPHQVDGIMDRQAQELTALLSALPVDEVVSFDRLFRDRLFKAYDYTLWGAAHLIWNGCSDDFFHDFRNWLISMGRPIYQRALNQPDSLAEVVQRPDIEGFFFEEISGIPFQVYEERTGRELPDPGVTHPREPTGTPFDADDVDYFQRTFPALWTLYGAQLSRPA